jgi:hypothetical protein
MTLAVLCDATHGQTMSDRDKTPNKRGSTDPRAQALRANLRRRKEQERGRAQAAKASRDKEAVQDEGGR